MSVSLSMRALLLIRLSGRQGQWVGADDLAASRQMPSCAVREGLQLLADDGHVHCRRGADGEIEAAMSAVRS